MHKPQIDMTTEEKTILKLAVLNDLMGIELSTVNIDVILEQSTKCKLKNALKNANILTEHFDGLIGDAKKSEYFGELCDYISNQIDNLLNTK